MAQSMLGERPAGAEGVCERPVLAFDIRTGDAKLFIAEGDVDYWLPVMETHSSLHKWTVIESEEPNEMAIVRIVNEIKELQEKQLADLIEQDLSPVEYKKQLKDNFQDKDIITAGVYVKIKQDNIDHWAIMMTGEPKKKKVNGTPKQWASIGLFQGENTNIQFTVNPDKIIFKHNSCVTQWLTFDEMQLHYNKEISADQKSRLLFRYRIRTSTTTEGHRLHIEMLVLPNNLQYNALPVNKRRIMDSACALTYTFWSQTQPIRWAGANKDLDVTFLPRFACYDSNIKLSDAIVRRLIFEVETDLGAGKRTTKVEEMAEFLTNNSKSGIFRKKELLLPLPAGTRIREENTPPENFDSGKIFIFGKTTKVRAEATSKYSRPVYSTKEDVSRLKSIMPNEMTTRDAINMRKIMSASVSDTSNTNQKSIKKKLLSLVKERNVLQEPCYGDDALLLTRLSCDPALKCRTVLQYMKVYKRLIILEGAVPPETSPQYRQLAKGLQNSSHNPMAFVATQQRKAYSISSLRIMGHAIAKTVWSELRKQAVYTTMLLAFWGRLRLAEILEDSSRSFKMNNAFLRKDLKFLRDQGGNTNGIQLWIRHAKVPDPAGALVEIPKIDKFSDICPVRAIKKYLVLRKKVTRDGESPLFVDDTNLLLTHRKYSDYVQEAINTLDIKLQGLFEDLKGHSLRAGVPTALQKLGNQIDPEIRQYLGRWKGNSVNLYMKDKDSAASARLAVASAIANNAL